MTTPYDGKIGLVYWSGQSVGENSISDLAATVHRWAPNARAIYVKTCDGNAWQGKFDQKPQMAINGPADITRWISTLAAYDLEMHAWCVLKGIDITGEADRVIAACNVPGLKSMLLDVEDGSGYFAGGAGDARYLIQRIRASIPNDFHLGLNFDARGQHPNQIHIDQWLPYVGSLHPMVYHLDFGKSIDVALADAFRVCLAMNKPVYPMLQAYGGVLADDLRRGAEIAMQSYKAGGISYFRLGTIGPIEFRAIQTITLPADSGDGSGEPEPLPTETVIVRPGDPDYSEGAYVAGVRWYTFYDVNGWLVKYKQQANPQQVYASYKPHLPGKGRYAIEVFIPGKNADTQAALYYVVMYENGRRVERKITLDQSIHFDQWVSLGVFDLDPTRKDDGRVNLVDYAANYSTRRVAFSAIRWRPVTTFSPDPVGFVADGFDAPVGTEAERRSSKLWPGHWGDANGYLNEYRDSAGNTAYHTGADLNLNYPRWNMDRGLSVYAVASGVVTWAGLVGDYWRNIIIIKHDPLPDGTIVYSRYGHVETMRVQAGERVKRGQQICVIGRSGGSGGNYHLHFDISPTDALQTDPGHWPGMDREEVARHYVDPLLFIRGKRP